MTEVIDVENDPLNQGKTSLPISISDNAEDRDVMTVLYTFELAMDPSKPCKLRWWHKWLTIPARWDAVGLLSPLFVHYVKEMSVCGLDQCVRVSTFEELRAFEQALKAVNATIPLDVIPVMIPDTDTLSLWLERHHSLYVTTGIDSAKAVHNAIARFGKVQEL